VTLKAESSVFYGAVLRADICDIVVGERSNVQDGACFHTTSTLPTIVGDDVTVGHKAILHACTVGNRVLVGMGAIVMDGCR
jgi:carbonic anhydrase/acetyltransferase-like protein (isoleucine patch superfamily)